MAQQTAVEWLVNELESKGKAWENGIISRIQISIGVSDYLELKRQAKQMEKEQSKQDYDAGLFDGVMDDVKDRLYKNAEQYYNETYGKE